MHRGALTATVPTGAPVHPFGGDSSSEWPRQTGAAIARLLDMQSRSRPVPPTLPQSMSTLLLADNAIMLHALMRHLDRDRPADRLTFHSPQWLLDAPSETVAQPVDFVLLDCSGVDADPASLIDALCRRVMPRHWLLIVRREAQHWIRRAAALGAGGCLLAPASPELVSAAVALVSAGGQCFPRTCLEWTAQPQARISNFLLPGSTASG